MSFELPNSCRLGFKTVFLRLAGFTARRVRSCLRPESWMLGGGLLVLFIFLACSENSGSRIQRYEKDGDLHFAREEYREALIDWQKVLKVTADAPGIHLKIGKAYLGLAEFYRAAEIFRRVTRLRPEAWEAWLELARIQLIAGDLTGAEDSWKKIAGTVTLPPEAHVFHGDLLLMKRDFAGAEQAYHRALAASRENAAAWVNLAACYWAQGKQEQSERVYENLSQLPTKSAAVWLQMGHYWRLREDGAKAEACYLKAVELRPNDLSLRKVIAEYFFDHRRFGEAQAVVEHMIRKDPKNETLKKFLVEIFLGQNRLAEARRILTECAAGGAEDLEWQLLKGKYHLFALEPFPAISQFQAALEKESKIPIAHYFLGLSYLLSEQKHLALQSFIRALTLDPSFSDAELALAGIYYKREEYDLCAEHARRVCLREPENYRGHLILGNALLAQGSYDGASREFAAAQRLHPDGASPEYFTALTAELSLSSAKALKGYESLLRKNPQFVDPVGRGMRLRILGGEVPAARQLVEEALRKRPKSGYLHHLLGEIHYSLGETAAAEREFEKTIALGPHILSAYMRLAEIYRRNGNENKETEILETCVEKIPHAPEAYMELGRIYIRRNLWAKGEVLLETAVAKNPESPLLMSNLAWLYMARGKDPDKAFNLAQSAYEKRPGHPAILDTFGWACFKLNLISRAATLLQEARRLNPANPMIYYHLGAVHQARGNEAAARECLEKAVAFRLEEPYLQEAKALLEGLRRKSAS